MSNLETDPVEVACGGNGARPGVQVIAPRDVPLGGPRAMTVRRTLPTRERSMIGAWCFVDHYGPDEVARTGGMVVPPHPHTGLATVSWLFTGRIEHRDSLGVRADVVPGELNLMTAGRGIAHSEVSTSDTTILHGVQLWLALPQENREMEPEFERFVPAPVETDGGVVSVFLGSLRVPGRDEPVASTASVHSPLVGAEIVLRPGSTLRLGVDTGHEHGVLADDGAVEVHGKPVAPGELAYVAAGPDELVLRAGAAGARVLLIGGAPFGEQIVMWWNFIGRSHDEIVAFRDAYMAEIAADADGTTAASGPRQFGHVDYDGEALPAPPLPTARLRPRG